VSEHDPMCNYGWDFCNVCTCGLIAKVRADEREKAAKFVTWMCSQTTHDWRHCQHTAIAAALWGES